MDIELQKYYEARFEMMGGKGWVDLMEDVEGMIQATDRLAGVTAETLPFKQGELNILRWLFGLKNVSNEAYRQLQESENEEPS